MRRRDAHELPAQRFDVRLRPVATIGDDAGDRSRVRDVVERIRIEDDVVRRCLHVKKSQRMNCCGLKRLEWRQT